jgi:hypothetical protein
LYAADGGYGKYSGHKEMYQAEQAVGMIAVKPYTYSMKERRS